MKVAIDFDDLLGLLLALKGACETIEGLAGQQAWPDEWYEEPLAEFRALLQ